MESQSQTPHAPVDSEPQILRTEESLAYKSLLENQVQQKLESQNLNEMVEKVLARLLPPLVERLVQERLDQLLTEQEQDLDPNQDIRL
jgi:FKBP-type peptidyl-prolyl cis-trans isomerase (trigger factor)